MQLHAERIAFDQALGKGVSQHSVGKAGGKPAKGSYKGAGRGEGPLRRWPNLPKAATVEQLDKVIKEESARQLVFDKEINGRQQAAAEKGGSPLNQAFKKNAESRGIAVVEATAEGRGGVASGSGGWCRFAQRIDSGGKRHRQQGWQ